MAGANTLEFTSDNFDQDVLESQVPVLVDFWAEWCMPCQALALTIDELADEYVGRAKVGKVNTDNSGTLAAKYGVSAIPTIILFKGGQTAKKFVGLTGKKDFKQALDEAVG